MKKHFLASLPLYFQGHARVSPQGNSPQANGAPSHHCLLDPFPGWQLKGEARQPTSRPAWSAAGQVETSLGNLSEKPSVFLVPGALFKC